MANFIEELLVGLGFEFEDNEEDEQFKKQTELVASAINKVAIAAGVATTALFAMSKAAASDNDELGKTAATLDTSAQALAGWRVAAELAGVDGQQVISMLEGLRTASQEAVRSGTGPFRAFSELGVDFEGIASGALDVSDALSGILAQAQTLDRVTAQGALRELGIDVRLLEVSPEELQQAFQFSKQFSNVTDDLTKASANFNDEWIRTQTLLTGTSNLIAIRLLPVFESFLGQLQDGLIWLQQTGIPILDDVTEALGGWDNILIGLTAVAGIPLVAALLTGVLTTVKAIGVGMALISAGAAASATALAPLVGLVAAAATGAAAGTFIQQKVLSDEQNEAIGDVATNALAKLGFDFAQQTLDVEKQTRESELRTAKLQAQLERRQAGLSPTDTADLDIPTAGSVENGLLSLMAPETRPTRDIISQSSTSVAGNVSSTTNNTTNAATPLTSRGSVVINNNFTGMNLSEVEQIMRRQQQEELEIMDNEANDSMVR